MLIKIRKIIIYGYLNSKLCDNLHLSESTHWIASPGTRGVRVNAKLLYLVYLWWQTMEYRNNTTIVQFSPGNAQLLGEISFQGKKLVLIFQQKFGQNFCVYFRYVGCRWPIWLQGIGKKDWRTKLV